MSDLHISILTPSTFFGDWDAKVGSQETPGVTGKFGLGIQEPSRIIEMKNTVAELKTKWRFNNKSYIAEDRIR